MSRIRVYIKTFNANGTYKADFEEITKHVQKVGSIVIDTDSPEYDIGVFRTSNVRLTLNNRTGAFSDVGQVESIFEYKRADAIVKITYDIAEDDFQSGFSLAGQIQGEEVELFRGFLNDDSFLEDIRTEQVEFILLGYESLLSKETVPFNSIANGQMVSAVLYACLNQMKITDHLTVSLANINPNLDQAIDDVTILENLTVREALNQLLNASNSVFYIRDSTIYVVSRDPGVAVEFNFYGQASENGAENVIDISKISNGMNRTFNFVAWKDQIAAKANAQSVNKYGVKKKEVGWDFFTNNTKQNNILQAIVDEFGLPKRELDIQTDITYDALELSLLSRVSIDYPTVLVPWESNGFPICGAAICGQAVLPTGIWTLKIDPADNWKILKKEIDVSTMTIKFRVRMI